MAGGIRTLTTSAVSLAVFPLRLAYIKVVAEILLYSALFLIQLAFFVYNLAFFTRKF